MGLQRQNNILQQKIDDIRLVDRAKCALIQYRLLTEPEAHKYIEREAMDSRRTRRKWPRPSCACTKAAVERARPAGMYGRFGTGGHLLMGKLDFTKMHGCGNDYVYIDCFKQDVEAQAAGSHAFRPAQGRWRRRRHPHLSL
ncbi:MAG: ANTAR domain-containing protein [Ruthenibacterium lactatiformans]